MSERSEMTDAANGLDAELVRAANRLTARWAATLAGESTVLSGVGLWPLLAFVAAGAAGPARDELAEAIGRPAAGADQPARELLAVLARADGISTALGVWAQASIPFTPWWTGALPAGAGGLLTGDSKADQAALDAWAGEQTDGLIQRMPVAVTPHTLMLLATAITVRTRWVEPLKDQPWRISTGPWAGPQVVAGLSGSSAAIERIRVADTPAGPITLLAVPGTTEVDVQLVLGEQSRAAGELLPAAIGALAGGFSRRTGLELPLGEPGPGVRVAEVPSSRPGPVLNFTTTRFSVSARHDLLKQAEVLGLVAASSPGHPFPLISPQPMVIGEARQAAVAIFTAEGFQAAAITAIMMPRGMSMQREVAHTIQATFDRPFGFVVTHRPTGLVLFVGWVATPEILPDGQS